MSVASSLPPSACKAIAPGKVVSPQESIWRSPRAPASASQRLYHDCSLASRLRRLAKQPIPGCQHPPHLYASLQPHAFRWMRQIPEACLALSRKMPLHTCRDVGSVGSVGSIFAKKIHICSLYPLLALSEPCHSLCLLHKWSHLLRLPLWITTFAFLSPFAPSYPRFATRQSLPQSTRVASERAGVGRCRSGVAPGVGGLFGWIGLSSASTPSGVGDVGCVGVFWPIFCVFPSSRALSPLLICPCRVVKGPVKDHPIAGAASRLTPQQNVKGVKGWLWTKKLAYHLSALCQLSQLIIAPGAANNVYFYHNLVWCFHGRLAIIGASAKQRGVSSMLATVDVRPICTDAWPQAVPAAPMMQSDRGIQDLPSL